MSILKSYLTSLEPDIGQSIYSQSIGGYCSTSLVFPETSLLSTIGLYDSAISLETPDDGWSSWQGVQYVNIGNEVIKVEGIVDGSITVVQRGYNGIINMHIAGDDVRALTLHELFNDVFNNDRKQYRCIAIKNDSSGSEQNTVYNFRAYIKKNSRNINSIVKMALETPKSQYLSSVSTSWTTMSIVDSSLVGLYADNHFEGAYLKIGSGDADGQGKIVASFESASGTFTFYNTFSSSFNYDTNVSYEVFPSPSQRVKTGIDSPASGDYILLPFVSNNEDSPMRFSSYNASVLTVPDLLPGDIVYLWLERTMEKGAIGFVDNDIVINIEYDMSV